MYKLDDIIPPSRRKEPESQKQQTAPQQEPLRPRSSLAPGKPGRFPYLTIATALLVIIASFGVLFYFSSAKVEVVPNSVSVAVQGSFTANQDSSAAASIPFQVITAQKIATQAVTSSGTKDVNSFSSGTIVVYNTQAKPQRLIANTRFATPSGLIFRIRAPITVPAKKASGPGAVTATVYADQAGSSYDIGPTSFTVPGLAGTPQENAVYARSSGAMTGGASGNVPVVDAATEAQARDALISALSTNLTASLATQVPSGYILLPGAATTTYQDLNPAPSQTSGMANVQEEGTVTAVVFPNADLAKAIATSVSGLNYQGEPLTLASTSALRFTMNSGSIDQKISSFSFALSGTASLVYTIDPARIAAAVSGKTRSAAEVALTNYPEIKRAIIVLRPFWRQSFPQDPSAISVVVMPH